MLFYIASSIFFLLLTFIYFVTIKVLKIIESKKLEYQVLAFALSTIEYKYYMLQMMELVYKEKIEQDATKQEEYEKVSKKIDEKFDIFVNGMIINIKKSLPYETEYKDWKGAAEFLAKTSREKNNGH